MYGINSKITNKIVHNKLNISLYELNRIVKYFGSDYQKYISNVNPSIFNLDESISTKSFNLNYQFEFTLNDNEKSNLVQLLNCITKLDEQFFINFFDHLNMIRKINQYDNSISFKSKTLESFKFEHMEISKLYAKIKKGWVVKCIFSEKMLNEIEKPIVLTFKDDNGNDVHNTYTPYILKTEEEYIEEGSFMHHCVASYIEKKNSLIISIRNDNNRITCEINTQNGICIQHRYFNNEPSPDDFSYVLKEFILPKTKKFATLGLLHCIEKRKTPYVINGIEVKKDKKEVVLNETLFF